MSPLYAAIDIGSNSALLLIAAAHGGALEPVSQKLAAPRVGRGLAKTGRISDDSFAALQAALSDFLAEIKNLRAALVGAVATEAFRRAANGPALLAQVGAQLGCECRILSGDEESRLGYLAVANRHPLPGLAVLDVGGGSTEVTQADGGRSFPLGAVTLLEACGHDVAACRERARAVFREAFKGFSAPQNLVAVGGTASALAILELRLSDFDAGALEGLELDRGAVTDAVDRLGAMPEGERAALPGIGPGRADILMPGLCILETCLEQAGLDVFRVSDRGIRYGVILDALETKGLKIEK